MLFEQAKGAELIVPATADRLRISAMKHLGDIVHPKALLHPSHAGQDFLSDDLRVGHDFHVAYERVCNREGNPCLPSGSFGTNRDPRLLPTGKLAKRDFY